MLLSERGTDRVSGTPSAQVWFESRAVVQLAGLPCTLQPPKAPELGKFRLLCWIASTQCLFVSKMRVASSSLSLLAPTSAAHLCLLGALADDGASPAGNVLPCVSLTLTK